MRELMNLNGDDISIEQSLNLFREFSVKSKDASYLPPIEAENSDFGSDFPGSLIHKPKYRDCRFHSSEFKASNGAFSIFDNCYFYDCNIDGSNLNYCNFTQCHFIANEKFPILNTGFNFSQFLNVSFDSVSFEGISFRDILVKDCIFNNCTMNDSSFERAIIADTKFENIDFRNIGIRYCQFENVIFKNVIFPILDLSNNIGLIDMFENDSDNIRFSLGTHGVVTFEEAKKLLLLLIPYYRETKQYFSILNIYLLNKQYDDTEELFQVAMEHSLKQCDFDTLYNICKLVSYSKLFDDDKLSEFYRRIKSSINPEGFPYNIQKGYIHYMDEIKDILLDNPHNLPRADIELVTNIPSSEPQKLTPIITEIESVFHEINPNISPCIQISHHSPYTILVFFYEHLAEIESICKIFYYSFGGMKALNDLKNSKREKAVNNTDCGNIDEETYVKTDFSLGPIHFTKETRRLIKSTEYCIANQ